MSDLSDCLKNLISKELESAIKATISDFSRKKLISEEVAQSLCNVLEAVFIHGLNDAFFLKGSRYSKYPEPNFWPFVSKFTQKHIQNQITSLKQIRNEVGRARAWIRIMLNENALENCVNDLSTDKNLRVFYQKSAFLRDHERVDSLSRHLKSLVNVRIVLPANSSLLNTWTPTPLIMAGLCAAGGNTHSTNGLRSRRLLLKSASSTSIVTEDGAADGPELVAGGGQFSPTIKFQKNDSKNSLFTIGSPQNNADFMQVEPDDEDDRSSICSHPSLMDGGIANAIPHRPSYNSIMLSCTPENSGQIFPPDAFFAYSNSCSAADAADELSMEVVVRRRKTRTHKISRQFFGALRSGNSSGGEVSRSESAVKIAEDWAADSNSSPSLEKTSPASLHDELKALNLADETIRNMSSTIESPTNQPSQQQQQQQRSIHSGQSQRLSAAIDCPSSSYCFSSFDTSDFSLPMGSFDAALRGAVGRTELFFSDPNQRKISQTCSVGSSPDLGDSTRTKSVDNDSNAAIDLSANGATKALYASTPRKASTASSWRSPAEKLIQRFEEKRRAANAAQRNDASIASDIADIIGADSAANMAPLMSAAHDGDRVKSHAIANSPLFSMENLLSRNVELNDSSRGNNSDDSIYAQMENSNLDHPLLDTYESKFSADSISPNPRIETMNTQEDHNEIIMTRNALTGDEVILHIFRRTEELEYIPLELDIMEDDVVVVDHHTLLEADEFGVTQDLLRITRIPIEVGLDAQDFRCPSCRKSIGGAFSSFKLCNLDCRYYCEDCWRRGDECLIPARMVWNWDCRRRPICKTSRAFIRSIADRPFIRIDKLNPVLYEHSKPMERIRNLRVKLSLAVMYLLSCKQSVAEDVRRRIFPHDYYHNDIHLYSINDLEGVLNGAMEKRLNKLITFCVSHVNTCALCFQKGFVCELCQSRRVIYPFQTEIAHRCTECYGVYHLECIESRTCPKCERRVAFSSPDFRPFQPQSPRGVFSDSI